MGSKEATTEATEDINAAAATFIFYSTRFSCFFLCFLFSVFSFYCVYFFLYFPFLFMGNQSTSETDTDLASTMLGTGKDIGKERSRNGINVSASNPMTRDSGQGVPNHVIVQSGILGKNQMGNGKENGGMIARTSPISLTEKVRNLVDGQSQKAEKMYATVPEESVLVNDTQGLASLPTSKTSKSGAGSPTISFGEFNSQSNFELKIDPKSLYPTVFHWQSGGSNVYLTGDFNNWAGKVPMHRSNNDFTLILDMPPGKYRYKFIVDGDWRHAADQPLENDENGVANNFVEVDPKQIYEFEQLEREESSNEIYENNRVAASDHSFLEYSQEFPSCFKSSNASKNPVNQVRLSSTDFMKDPPILPPQLYDVFLNNSTKYADPYVLPVPQNVTLHHLFNATPLVRSEEVLVVGITQRYQSKFVTTITYMPNLKKLAKSASQT